MTHCRVSGASRPLLANGARKLASLSSLLVPTVPLMRFRLSGVFPLTLCAIQIHSLTIRYVWLGLMLWLDVSVSVDIDECAVGGVAEKCSVHGKCDGLKPAGSYTCTCHNGYTLDPTATHCISTFRSLDRLIYRSDIRMSTFIRQWQKHIIQ